MHNFNPICPDCVEYLKLDKKELGKVSVWLVCPCCGYRVRHRELEADERQKYDDLRNLVQDTNETGGKKEQPFNE